MGMRRLLGTTVLLAGLLSAGVSAQDLPDQNDALRALASLAVEVQLVGAADRMGIDAAEVRLHAIDAAGGYAFMVSVQFMERMVSLRRYVELVLTGELPTSPADSIAPLDLTPSVRWQARALGTSGSERARTFIPESLLGYIDQFLEDYRAANGR
jgi:hypothetical protein